MVRSGGASRCSGGERSIVFLVQGLNKMWVPHSLTGQHLVGSQEVANVCSLSAIYSRWSRAFLITAALFIPRADSLSLGHVVMEVLKLQCWSSPGQTASVFVMEVLKLQRRHQRHCPSPRQSKLNVAMHPVELQKACRPCMF